MSTEFYRVFHICGILLLFSGLSALWALYASGATLKKSQRVLLSIVHGVGMIIVLIAGFGLAAKLHYLSEFPTWLTLKLLIWLVLGLSMILAKRKSAWGVKLLIFWVALGTGAAYLAHFRPF